VIQILYNGDTVFHGDAAANGTDGLIMSGSVNLRVSLFGDELAEDTMTFRVNSNALTEPATGYSYLYTVNMEPVQTNDEEYYVIETGSVDWRNFTYGAPVLLYNRPGGSIIGRFYLLDVKQVSRKTLEFVCTDGIGMLARMGDHNGGLYNGETFGSVVGSIFAGSNIAYELVGDVRNATVRGRLPRANRRLNLADVLNSTGATIVESGGMLYIRYLSQNSPQEFSKVYLNGNDVSYGTQLATEVQVLEHSFYALASDPEVTLFDNTGESIAISNQLVVFNEPVHDLATTGTLTVSESNINYAVVSGVGTLVGQEYTHNTRVISRPTGLTGKRYVKILEDNQLIGLHNSANVSRRMAAYYSTPISAKVEGYDETGLILPGTMVSFTDAYGTERTGYVKSQSFDLGNKFREHYDVLTGWTPGPFGDSYSAYKTFTSSDITSGRINFPPSMVGKDALIVLFGGAQGGQGGYDGEAGEAPSGQANYGKIAPGGLGGMPGNPGDRGMVLSVQVAELPEYYDNASIGVGGAGGARNGGLGARGTATTLGSWSSADGSPLLVEHINFVDGTVYGEEGKTGTPGGNGGYGKGAGARGSYHYVAGPSQDGGAVLGIISGGAHDDGKYFYDTHDRYYYTGGAGGGGAAYLSYGNDGVAGYDPENWISYGGDGANATAFVGNIAATVGGRGGNGGGGGGGCACGLLTQGANETYGYNTAGAGGKGSAGTKGGDGLILVYYNE